MTTRLVSREWIRSEISEQIKQQIAQLRGELQVMIKETVKAELETKKMDTSNLALMKLSDDVTNAATIKVMGEINTKVLPKINNIVQWVGHQLQDGNEMVNEYRRDITRADIMYLTDGKIDRTMITPHVRTMFAD